MSLNEALALVVRGVRKSRGLSQEDLNTVDRSYLVRIEAGRANVTLEMLQRIATLLALEFEVLVLLTSAVRVNEPMTSVCQRLSLQVAKMQEEGIFQSIADVTTVPRAVTGRAKKANAPQNAAAALRLKESGMTLAEIARELNLSKTTIHRYLSR
jgi:transcriptional regulator with XRE-family HTH domain